MDADLQTNKQLAMALALNSHLPPGCDLFHFHQSNTTNCTISTSFPAAAVTHSTTNSTTTFASAPDETTPQDSSSYTVWQLVFITVICSVIVAGTVLGNVLVCTAVSIVRKLRTPSNLLIVSLAVSDLLVALLDMPFATVYEVMGRWVFGQTVCDIWTSLDVLLCTASILNLCMISIDRYFVITRPFQYAMKRTPVRMLLMIAAAWSLSAIISIPPLFGWRADPKDGFCSVSQAIGYQFYATIGAFYLPLTVMIIIYTRIYLVSYRIAQAEASARPPTVLDGTSSLCPPPPLRPFDSRPSSGLAPPSPRSCTENSLRLEDGKLPVGPVRAPNTTNDEEENHNMHNGKQAKNSLVEDILPRSTSPSVGGGGGGGGGGVGIASKYQLVPPKSRGHRLSSSNERKATKTLGVIMGAFTACWLPFFILALIKPFCRKPETCIPHWLNSLFLWLGYTNSFLNPIIYARFNRDFRTPFKHILQCRCRDINSRLRSENFAEQFGPADPRDGGRSLPLPPTPATAETFVRFSCQGRAVVKLK